MSKSDEYLGGYEPDPRIFMPDLSGLARAPKGEDLEAIVKNMQAGLASELGDRLYEKIQDYDAKLDNTQEVGVRLVNFGQAVVFHLEAMECVNPSLICFIGTTTDGQPVELIQHVTQLSILLTKVSRRDPSKPKEPIGFVRDGKE